jgi:hypothetical protein
VQLVHIGCKRTLQGKSYRVLDKKIINCEEDADSHWRNAVATLETALADFQGTPLVAKVILSNYFMRYAIVPWSESLSNEAEELAYAKHYFSQLYGTNADSWDLRMSQDFVGAPQFTSAVETELLNSLRALFEKAKIKLQSVQPYLMTAYNNSYAALREQDAWFVLYEQGSLCLGLVQQGHWSSVRTIKVGNDWLDRLPEILDREVTLSELDTSSDEIFLWAPEHWTATLPKSVRWKINKLQPVVQAGLAPEYTAHFAMAMCG